MKPLDELVKSSLLGIVEVDPVEIGTLWDLEVGMLWAHVVVGTLSWVLFAFVSGSSLDLVVVASWVLLVAVNTQIYQSLLHVLIFH